MRLFLFEIYKLFCQRIVVLSCLGMAAANIFSFYFVEKNTTARYHYSGEAYKRFQDTYGNEQTPEERTETLQRLYDLHSLYYHDYWMEHGKIAREEYTECETKMIEKYGEVFLKELEDIKQELDYDTFAAYTVYIQDWLTYAEYALKYAVFRNEMKQRMETLQKISLFSKPESFVNANLLKTYKDFEHLGDVKISYNNQYGVRAYLEYNKYIPVFLLFTVFILCVGIWQKESEKNLLRLLKSQKKGKIHLYAAKMCALFFGICLMNLIYLISIFLAASHLYGMELSMSIQSIETYRDCCWNLNAGQFIILCGITQTIVWCVYGLIFFFYFQLFQKNTLVYIMCGIFVLICLGCYVFIQPGSIFSIFKYINPVYGVQPWKLYGIYQNLNLFGKAVSIFPVLTVFIALWFLIGSILNGIFWCTKTKTDYFTQKISSLRKKRIHGAGGILRCQLYEFFIRDKKIIFCLLLLIYGVYTAFYSSVFYITQDEIEPMYKEYIQGLEGMLTKSTEEKINERELFFENVWKRLEILGEMQSLDEESYAEITALYTLSNIPYRAFQTLKEQYDYLLERKEQKKEAVLLDTYNWNRLFQKEVKEVKNLMFAILMTIFLSSSIFADHSNMKHLTASMKKGRRSLWRRQYILGLSAAILSWGCLILPEVVRFFRQNNISLAMSKIGNLLIFSQSKEDVSIAALTAGMYFCYLLACMVAACTVMLLVDLTGNSFNSMAVMAVPVIIGSLILIEKKQGIFCKLVTYSVFPMRNLCLIMLIMLLLIGIALILWEKEVLYPKGKRKVGLLIWKKN